MNRTPPFLVSLAILIWVIPSHLQAQTILQQTVCRDISFDFQIPRWMLEDPKGGYILCIHKNQTDTEGLYLEDALVPSYHFRDDDFSSSLEDLFICKLNEDFSLHQSLVIDNAELSQDVFCGDAFVLYSMSIVKTTDNHDSFPILINGEIEIPRKGNQGKGVVVVMDNELQPLYNFLPSTGDIGQVTVDGHMAYLELRIPDFKPYIIVNETDTIYNQHRYNEPNSFGRQTVVLCKYDLLTHEVVWTLRIGNVGYEELREMKIDQHHNLVILGETSSTYFSFHDTDTIMNYADHSPFVARYNADGEFLSGFINPNDENAYARTMLLDKADNIYIASFYYGDDYIIADTMLIRPGIGQPTGSQGIITKLNAEGSFEWIMQAEGDFERSGFYDIAELNDEHLVLSGDFRGGKLVLNGQTYVDDPVADKWFGFLLFVNKQTGVIDTHAMTIGSFRRDFYNIEVDPDGRIDLFMRYRRIDTIFGAVFESPLTIMNGYLLKLSISPVAIEDIQPEAENFTLMPNPVLGEGFTLEFTNASTLQNMSYIIYDTQGYVMAQNSISPHARPFISTQDWPAGPYWIQIRSDQQFQTHLFMVQ